MIRSSRSGGDSDEFQGLSRGGKAVGEGAGRHLAGSNWLPSSRDRLSREKMRLACALLGKQKHTAQESEVVEEAISCYWGPHCLLGRGTGKRQGQILLQADGSGARFWLPAPALLAFTVHKAPPKPFLMGGAFHFPG